MTTRDVRDLIVQAWEARLRRAGVPNAYALALDLAVITESHGVKLHRPAHLHDPGADWRTPVDASEPVAEYLAARRAQREITAADAGRHRADLDRELRERKP